MRNKLPRGGSTSSRRGVRGCAFIATLAGCWLAGALPSNATADACPNAQFRVGPSAHLPDCRAYEQVSPVEKGGADAVTVQPLFPAQSSACGSDEACAIAYMNVATAFGGAAGNEISNAYLATRGAGGWQTTALTPPTPQAPAGGHAKIGYAFSPDLSQLVLRVPLQPLTEDAPPGVYNLFLRGPDGGYSLLTTSAPPEPPEAGCGGCFEREDMPAFAGASGNFKHVIFEANDSLVKGAPGDNAKGERVENLYETDTETGTVSLVGVLPDGAIPPKGATAGSEITVHREQSGELDHAISQDGSHVLFEAEADGGLPDPQQLDETELYDRVDGSSTVEVSAPAPGAEPSRCETVKRICDPGSAKFWGASADGSILFFTSKAALTEQSNTGEEEGSQTEDPGNDLYRYNLDSKTLTDLTPDESDPDGAGVLGVVGTSEEGSYVYFVADGKLEGTAHSGEPNLCVWHGTAEGEGTVKFIAALDAPDTEEEEGMRADIAGPAFPYDSDILDWSEHPNLSQAYVTPDGEHLAFMSVNPLTDYDNEDPVATREAGHPVFDHEVFEYSAETGQIVCASCDPGGAPPLGSAFIGAKLTERVSTPFHQPRALSESGERLFFSSPDPLVPGLAGGTVKVFEYEHGTVQLISGMGEDGEGVFLDASASGNDVFFATREQLAPSDTDELADVYDARVDGGLPAPPAPPPVCQDSACQGPFDSPPLFSVPISALFTGAGNLPPPPSAKPTDKQLLARALAVCRRVRSRKKHSRCIESAERRYAPKVKRSHRTAASRRPRSRR